MQNVIKNIFSLLWRNSKALYQITALVWFRAFLFVRLIFRFNEFIFAMTLGVKI